MRTRSGIGGNDRSTKNTPPLRPLSKMSRVQIIQQWYSTSTAIRVIALRFSITWDINIDTVASLTETTAGCFTGAIPAKSREAAHLALGYIDQRRSASQDSNDLSCSNAR